MGCGRWIDRKMGTGTGTGGREEETGKETEEEPPAPFHESLKPRIRRIGAPLPH